MKILMLEWDSFAQEYIIQAFQKAGCQIEIYPWPFGKQNMRDNMVLKIDLEKKLREEVFAFVFSLNFFPVASEACFDRGVQYVAWVYDSPYLLLYSKHIRYETTTVYIFDKSLCERMNEDGISNIYYMPMAAPVGYYDGLRADKGRNFQSDISFVGSLYTEENQNFYKKFEGIKSFARGYIEAIIQAQKNIYGTFLLEDLLNESVMSELKRVCPVVRGDDEWESEQWIYANYFLARRLTGIQREEILGLISDKYDLKLYAPAQSLGSSKIINCGPVDYIEQMPYIFKNSKINLNITLRSIHSGIPLRAMDIMGCGGFLLTNYQEDFLDFFEADVDYVYYTDNEDLMNKIEYYLSHDKQREEIARNGHDKMLLRHTYDRRVAEILDRIKGESD